MAAVENVDRKSTSGCYSQLIGQLRDYILILYLIPFYPRNQHRKHYIIITSFYQ
jgi:hypothetical protein